MKFKKIMLVTFVLLAILTLGAVSASENTDFNETLTVDNLEEVSIDAPLEDKVVSVSGDGVVATSDDDKVVSVSGDGVVAASDDDVVSNVTYAISTSADDIYEGEDAVIDCELYGLYGGNASVVMMNRTYIIDFGDGSTASLSIPNLNAGSYEYDVFYNHDVYALSAHSTFNVLAAYNGTVDENTFDNIQTLIYADEDGLVELSGDYWGDGNSIEISKPIVIDGNGATLDADGKGNIFEVYSDNVIIRNITFRNSVGVKSRFIPELESEDSYGSAILIGEDCKDIIIMNCTFINCSAMEGAAIWSGGDSSIVDCSFIDCHSGFNSAAVQFIDQVSYSIENCMFSNCHSDNNGGAVYARNSAEGTISNSMFVNCSSPWGGAFIADGGVHSIIDCNFIDCSGEWGGAINFWESDALLIGCSFVNCIAISGGDDVGGAIQFRGESGGNYNLSCSSFTNCSAKDGGAINHEGGDLSVTDSIFSDCSAEKGGAIYSGPVAYATNCEFTNCTSFSTGIAGAVYNVIYTDCIFDGENATGEEINNGGDNQIDVNIWNSDEEGPLYIDYYYDVVRIGGLDGLEGTISVIVNDEREYLWDIDDAYHGWNLKDLEITEIGDYNMAVKHDDEVIANETISVVEFNESEIRLVFVSDRMRIFYPGNVTGVVRVIIEGEDEFTYQLTQKDFNRWIEWTNNDLGLELNTYYFITVNVLDNDDVLYNHTEWYQFVKYDDDSEVRYLGSEEIIARQNVDWKSLNYFRVYHEQYVEGRVSVYINGDNEFDEPDYILDLTTSPTGYYSITLKDLGITGPGEYDIAVYYQVGDDFDGIDKVITVYEPQTVTGKSGHSISGDFYLTIDILPVKRIITGNVYTDYVITFDGFFEHEMDKSSTILVDFLNGTILPFDCDELVGTSKSLIGSKELGIYKEGTYNIVVRYCSSTGAHTFNCPGTIRYLSTVLVDVSMYNLHREELYIGYGLDNHEYITIGPRNDYSFDDIEGTVSVYIDGELDGIFDVQSLDIHGDDDKYYFIPLAKLNVTEGNHYITVIYEGNQPGVEVSQNFTAVTLTPEIFSEFGNITIKDNVSIESNSSPININFWGNPMSADPMIWGNLVVYVNGQKVDKTKIVFCDNDNDETYIYDINDAEAIELKNQINANILKNWEYTEFDWLNLAYLHWYCNRGNIDLSLEDLGITKSGTYNIAVRYIGEAGGNEELLLATKNLRVNGKANPELSVSVDDVNVGEIAIINVALNEDITGEVIVSVANANYTVNIVDGAGSLNISDLRAGSYDVVVSFAGDDNFIQSQSSTSFSVNKIAAPEIVIDALDRIPEGSDLNVRVSISGADGIVYINNEECELFDGVASAVIYNVTAGDLLIDVVYPGDDRYMNASNRKMVNVYAKLAFELSVSVSDIDYGDVAIINITLDENINDNVSVSIGGDDYTVNAVNGSASLILSDLPADSYDVKAVFDGNDMFLPCEGTASFTVNRVDAILELSGDTVYDYGSVAVINVEVSGANAAAKIDGSNVYLEDGVISLDGLDAGNHILTVTAFADANHNDVVKSINITVNKVDSTLSLSGSTKYYSGDVVVINVRYVNATGVIAEIDGKNVDVPDGVISIAGLDPGEHYLTVTTVVDKNHNAVNETLKINIYIHIEDLQVDPIVYTYGGAGSTNVSCSGLLNVEADIINHTEADVVVNGSVITVSNLSAGQYLLNIRIFTVGGNAEETVNVTVDKANSTLSVANVAFNYGASGSTNAVYTGATGITAVVVGHSEAVIKINGNKITLSGLNAGTYTLKVETIPDANYISVVKTATVKVNKLNTALTATKVTTTYGTSKKLYVTLKDINTKQLKGKKISIKLNGRTYSAKTMSNGKATFTVPATLATKTYKATITFAGDTNYNKKTGSVSVVVKKANVKLTAAKKSYSVGTKTKVYNVILKSDKNKAIAKGKVTLKVGGKTYSVKTNSKGVAVFKITNLNKKGTFKANVKFFGNANFNAKAVNTNIIVK